MSATVIIEGKTLEDCRKKAAAELGVPGERLEIKVLQKARQGFFSATPFRVQASVSGEAAPVRPDASSHFLGKLNTHVAIVTAEMEKVEALRDEKKGGNLDEILNAYNDLSDELRNEIRGLSGLLSGDNAKQVQEKISREGRFRLDVSEDCLAVTLDVKPSEGVGRAVTFEDIRQKLVQLNVTFGVDAGAIQKVLSDVSRLGQPVSAIPIAQGRHPRHGNDGHVEFLVKPPSKETVVRQDGTVDHRGAAGITMVKAGQVLARIVPPSAGEPGMTVHGVALPAQAGRPAALTAGENVEFNAAAGEYRSIIDGVLEATASRIAVKKSFRVSGDVDVGVGNIEFGGSVVVSGSVRDGFAVRAVGDIVIQGSVEGCEIVSEKGSVRVGQGVAGRGHCFISAGADVEAKFIENAIIHARGNVIVGTAILHSEVAAGDSVVAINGRGAIIGGVTQAGKLVHALVLGAANEPPTLLILGVSDEAQEKIRAMDGRLVSLQNTTARLDGVIREFEHVVTDISKLPLPEREKYVELRKKKVVLLYELEKLKKMRQEFMDGIAAQAVGEVRVSKEVFPKVTVRIGQYQDVVTSMISGTLFRVDTEKGQIVRGR
ncbi:MAG: FapA family protein [Planctomycetota bacterium]